MATTDAQKRAAKKWQTEKMDEVRFRVPKGQKAMIENHASTKEESVTAFLRRAVAETMERDLSNMQKD